MLPSQARRIDKLSLTRSLLVSRALSTLELLFSDKTLINALVGTVAKDCSNLSSLKNATFVIGGINNVLTLKTTSSKSPQALSALTALLAWTCQSS
jgi:hypothetical protein